MTDERTAYIKQELLQSLRRSSWRIGILQRELEAATAERERLRRHLRQVEEEADRC